MAAALQRNPVGDERAGVDARERSARRAQMPEPAEAEQFLRPLARRRRHLEGRTAVGHYYFSGEGELAGIDFARDGRIAGAQILRRDQEAIRHLQPDLPAETRIVDEAHDDFSPAMMDDERREPDALGNSLAAHFPAMSFPDPSSTYRSGVGCPPIRKNPLSKPPQTRGIKAVTAGKPLVLIRKIKRKRAQIAARRNKLLDSADVGGGDGHALKRRIAREQCFGLI